MRIRFSFSSRHTGNIAKTNKHRKEVYEIVDEVIKNSDIILEVLDSRFIEETRNKEIEKRIKEAGKKLIYVLNKSDLIDETKLRNELKDKKDFRPFIFISTKTRRGALELRTKIGIEASRIDKKDVQVGVIGYPNTGKSSLINFLTGRKAAGTSMKAGFTKGMMKVRLAPHILIFDTPGLIALTETKVSDKDKYLAKHAQIGVKTFDSVREPEMIVQELMKKYPGLFEKYFDIDAQGDAELLLENLGRKKNLIKKGNEVDIQRTARYILKEWQSGKIRPL